jgi:hypothetical protein
VRERNLCAGLLGTDDFKTVAFLLIFIPFNLKNTNGSGFVAIIYSFTAIKSSVKRRALQRKIFLSREEEALKAGRLI